MDEYLYVFIKEKWSKGNCGIVKTELSVNPDFAPAHVKQNIWPAELMVFDPSPKLNILWKEK